MDDEYAPMVAETYSLEMKSDVARTENSEDVAENKLVSEMLKIVYAINQLDPYNRKLIHDRYIDQEDASAVMIYTNLGMSESKYYRLLGKAQLEFAEHYEKGVLKVKQERIEITQ